MTCSITFVLAGVSLLVCVCVYFVFFKKFFSFLFYFFLCVYVFVCLEHDFYKNNNKFLPDLDCVKLLSDHWK